MKNESHNPNWGGARANAGRKPMAGSKGKAGSKVYRLPPELGDFAKSGKLEELLAVIGDWDEKIATSSKTSPRWSKARAMMDDIRAVLNDK